MPTARVNFQPHGKRIDVAPGTSLADAAAQAGLALNMPCGGEGTCGKCRVILRAQAAAPTAADQRYFTAAELTAGYRLACQTAVDGSTIVEVPPGLTLATQHQILVASRTRGTSALDPAVRKHYVELALPARGDDAPDLVRLERVLGPVKVDLELLRGLPSLLRAANFRGTAVMIDGELVDFEPGDTRAVCAAVAVDVGTTTLAAALVDLNTGDELAVVSRLNPQTRFGDDVVSRIQYAGEHPSGLAELAAAVAEAIDAMIGELAERAALSRAQIYEVALAGNTTMQHLLCRIDPRWLGEVPFVSATGRGIGARAASLGLAIHPRGRAYVLPVIGGFVGGDTVAGMLATAMADHDGPALLVDIGTNGEIVLSAAGKLWAAAAAAGPAFEGARISHGMRASAGAIERVALDGDVRLSVIGHVPPAGLCGSALIDIAAELLRHRLLSAEGRLATCDALPPGTPAELARRVVLHDQQVAFLLADADQAAGGRPIALTQRDIRQLQLASGAIRAGIVLLLRRAGLQPAELDVVLVAGGFGNYIRRTNAQRIGLLPPEIPRDRILYQGNTSLAGARLAVLSLTARQQAEVLARRTEHIDLSTDHGFQWAFADGMIFPDE